MEHLAEIVECDRAEHTYIQLADHLAIGVDDDDAPITWLLKRVEVRAPSSEVGVHLDVDLADDVRLLASATATHRLAVVLFGDLTRLEPSCIVHVDADMTPTSVGRAPRRRMRYKTTALHDVLGATVFADDAPEVLPTAVRVTLTTPTKRALVTKRQPAGAVEFRLVHRTSTPRHNDTRRGVEMCLRKFIAAAAAAGR